MIIYDNDKTVFKGTKIQLMTETILLLRTAVEKGIFSKFDIELIAEGASLSDEELEQRADEQTALDLMALMIDTFGEDKAREIFNNINK